MTFTGKVGEAAGASVTVAGALLGVATVGAAVGGAGEVGEGGGAVGGAWVGATMVGTAVGGAVAVGGGGGEAVTVGGGGGEEVAGGGRVGGMGVTLAGCCGNAPAATVGWPAAGVGDGAATLAVALAAWPGGPPCAAGND